MTREHPTSQTDRHTSRERGSAEHRAVKKLIVLCW